MMDRFNRNDRKVGFIQVMIVCLLATQVSCRQYEQTLFSQISTGGIVPKVFTAEKTRSDEPEKNNGLPVATYDISKEAGRALFIQVFEEDITELPFDTHSTKGSELTTTDIGSFQMKAFAEGPWFIPSIEEGQPGSSTNRYPAGEYFNTVSATRSGSSWEMLPTQYWLQEVPITFWSWNFVEPVINSSLGNNRATFTEYATPLSTDDQKDLLFAYNREMRRFGNDGKTVTEASSSNTSYNRKDNEMDIRFYHALSEIRFCVQGIQGAVLKSVTLKNILRYSASCDITVSDGIPEFTWNQSDSSSSYDNFRQTFTASDFDSYGNLDAGSGKAMFMIPHTLRNDATIEITLASSSDPTDVVKISVPIAKVHQSDTRNVQWEAGKYYTYRLTTDPFAYTWKYEFALPSPDDDVNPTQQTVSYVITDTNVVNYIDISSLKVRQDHPSIGGTYGYHIKSYQVGNGTVQSVDGTFSDSDAGLSDVRIDEQNRLVLPICAKELLDRGSHRYWYDLTDGTAWHPADWVDETESDPLDLSRMDYRTDDINLARNAFQMSTANCYIIRHAGWYKLPLVYGNAVLNGASNTSAYAPFPNDHDDGNLVLGVFKNHLDEEITSPFIENNAGCDVSTCDVLWQANGNAVQQLSIEGTPRSTDDYTATNVRYLKFYMDPNFISQNNSLIAIKDDQGRIIWSWQIWSTNDPLLLEAPIGVTSYAGNKYWFFQIPSIGRIIRDEYQSRPDVTITLAQDSPSTMPDLKVVVKQPAHVMDGEFVTYQFGRKDPIRTGANVHSVPTATAPVSLGTLIQNPGTFYTFPSSDRYVTANGPKYKNLWSGKDTRVTGSPIERTSDMIKTIYDPSPIGYKVPASGAYSGFTTTGVHSFWIRSVINATSDISLDISTTDMRNLMNAMGGMNLYTSLGPGHTLNTGGPVIWFPKDGMRAGMTGNWSVTTGMYYTCNFKDMDNPYVMIMGSSLGVNTASPCNGHNIRCVTDPGFTPWWTSTGAPK